MGYGKTKMKGWRKKKRRKRKRKQKAIKASRCECVDAGSGVVQSAVAAVLFERDGLIFKCTSLS